MKKKIGVVFMLITALMLGMTLVPFSVCAVTDKNAAEALDRIKTTPPTLSADKSRVNLPSMNGYDVQIYGSSNEAVIRTDGTVIQPLCDMTVKVMYKVTSKSDPADTAVDHQAEASIVVPGKYSAASGDNARPQTFPSIREWKGSVGSFRLTDGSRLVIANEVCARRWILSPNISAGFCTAIFRLRRVLPVRAIYILS